MNQTFYIRLQRVSGKGEKAGKRAESIVKSRSKVTWKKKKMLGLFRRHGLDFGEVT